MVANLKYLRLRNGISQADLAAGLGTTQQTVNKYENSSTEPDIDTLVAMARFFNTSVDFLIGNTDIERKYEIVYDSDLNYRELCFMETFRETDEAQQNLVLNLLKELSKKKDQSEK